MTAAQIAEAVEALNAAGYALRCGNFSIPDQMRLATRCYDAAATLRLSMKQIEVPIKKEPE